MAMEVDVAIVGGGMGGLALAVGLQNSGIRARVFEKSPKKRKHFGTGMSIGENGIQALEGIKPGLSDKMEAVGQHTAQFTLRIRMPGEEEKLIAPAPQLTESARMFTIAWKGALDTLTDELNPNVVHYGHKFVDYELVEDLVDELNPNVVHYGHKFVDFKLVEYGHKSVDYELVEVEVILPNYTNVVQAATGSLHKSSFLTCALKEGVEVRFEVKDGQDGDLSTDETKVVKAKLLVGADGVWSPVRKLVVGDEPRDLWLITWLAIVPTDSIRELHLQDDDEIKFINYPSTMTGMITCYCGSGYTLWQYRVPDKSGELTKSFASDFHAHGREARKLRVLKQIEGAEQLQNLKTAMERSESSQIREDRNFDRVPVSSWSDSSGRVVLLGDAAHGMYPGPGMGARIAFEDAHQLTLLLQEAFSSQTPETALPDAIKRYEEVRIPRCTKLQGFAAELTSWPCFVPEWVQKLSPGERAKRTREFYRWINKYPADVAGDPDSIYWKPEQDES